MYMVYKIRSVNTDESNVHVCFLTQFGYRSLFPTFYDFLRVCIHMHKQHIKAVRDFSLNDSTGIIMTGKSSKRRQNFSLKQAGWVFIKEALWETTFVVLEASCLCKRTQFFRLILAAAVLCLQREAL